MPVLDSRIEVYEMGHRVRRRFRPPLTITSLFHDDDAVLELIRKAGAGGLWGTSNGHRAFISFRRRGDPSHRAHRKTKVPRQSMLGRYVADPTFCSSQRFIPRSSWRRSSFHRIFGDGTPRWSTDAWRADRTCAAIWLERQPIRTHGTRACRSSRRRSTSQPAHNGDAAQRNLPSARQTQRGFQTESSASNRRTAADQTEASALLRRGEPG